MEVDAEDFSGDLPVDDAATPKEGETPALDSGAVTESGAEPASDEEGGPSQDFRDWSREMGGCDVLHELQALGLIIRNAANLLPESELSELRDIYEKRSVVLKAKVRAGLIPPGLASQMSIDGHATHVRARADPAALCRSCKRKSP